MVLLASRVRLSNNVLISRGAYRIVIWTLNRGGPRSSIITASALLLAGNWIRYAGTRAGSGNFGVAMLGQILIGFSQPFVLTAPTRYSDIWFTGQGRTSATAVASLANPLGGALGQLIGPLLATDPEQIPNLVLYVSIIVSPLCLYPTETHQRDIIHPPPAIET